MGVKVAVLGGLGLMAEAALHDLARSTAVGEILAVDLHTGRKDQVLARLPARRKVRVLALDVSDTASSARALRGVHVVLNAAWYELNLKAMDLALELKAHYVDLGGLYHMTLRQLRRSGEFVRARLLAALGCGSTPGITNMMVARMAEDFDRVDSVAIYDASHDPALTADHFLPPFSIRTMLDEYVLPAPVWEGGKVVSVNAHDLAEELEFKAPIGRCTAGAVIHSEVATLPAYLKDKKARSVAFKIAYPEPVKAQLAMLVAMGLDRDAPVRVNGAAVSPRRFLTELAQRSAAGPAGRPADFEVLRVDVRGTGRGGPLRREWDCEMRPAGWVSAGAAGVGFTASIAAQMLAAGSVIRHAGAFAPESCLHAPTFFKELTARKVFQFVERVERSPL